MLTSSGETDMLGARRTAFRWLERARRSMAEFLALPMLMVVGFFVLALATYVIDHDAGARAHWGPTRTFLGRYVGDSASSTSLLTTIAGSLITVTSITFSILLLAVQQGASTLTSQIIDHYLRRPSNQIYFGFFVGVSVYTLVTLVLTTAGSRPVLGVTLATVFAAAALFALILLIYSTINQIRPNSVIAAIHDAALSARRKQSRWIAATAPLPKALDGQLLTSDRDGYLARVLLKDLHRLLSHHPGASLDIAVPVGARVSCGETLATLSGAPLDPRFKRDLLHALPVEEQRDLSCDAALAVDHLVDIGWTAISTAKSNPAIGVTVLHALRDLLYRWAPDAGLPGRSPDARVRYNDTLSERLVDGFETLMVVSSESMQHQTLAAMLDALSAAFTLLPEEGRRGVRELILNLPPTLGDHVPTRRLEASVLRMVGVLDASGCEAEAHAFETAWRGLARARGVLSSRGNREQATPCIEGSQRAEA